MFKYIKCIVLLFIVNALHAENAESQNPTQSLIQGFLEFKDLTFKEHEKEFVRLVVEGQSPQVLFITCSDSRVVPDLLLQTRPGDLFVARTAGNFIPSYQLKCADGVGATIEYAIEVLKIRHIIVCGHSHCGAVQGLFSPLDSDKFPLLKNWLQFGEAAKTLTLKKSSPSAPKEEIYKTAEKISVLYQLQHLMTYPFVKSKVDKDEIVLHGWYYTIETGEIEYYDPTKQQFLHLDTR